MRYGWIVLFFASAISAKPAYSETRSWSEHLISDSGAPGPGASLPSWVYRYAAETGIATTHDLVFDHNPFMLSGDFDGNGVLDYCFWVVERKTRTTGLAFFLSDTVDARIVGAGVSLGSGGDDFGWADVWTVAPKNTLAKSYWEDSEPEPHGDYVAIGKFESASGAIYWNGHGFVWYQTSD